MERWGKRWEASAAAALCSEVEYPWWGTYQCSAPTATHSPTPTPTAVPEPSASSTARAPRSRATLPKQKSRSADRCLVSSVVSSEGRCASKKAVRYFFWGGGQERLRAGLIACAPPCGTCDPPSRTRSAHAHRPATRPPQYALLDLHHLSNIPPLSDPTSLHPPPHAHLHEHHAKSLQP